MNINKNDFVQSLKQAGDTVVQKVDGLYQRTRLSFSISSKENELADLYRELGQTVYEQKKGLEAQNMSQSALIAMIDACISELETLRSRKSSAGPTYRFCPACGRPVSEKANFCAVCGAKIETDPEPCKDVPCCDGEPCPEGCCEEPKRPFCDGEPCPEGCCEEPKRPFCDGEPCPEGCCEEPKRLFCDGEPCPEGCCEEPERPCYDGEPCPEGCCEEPERPCCDGEPCPEGCCEEPKV